MSTATQTRSKVEPVAAADPLWFKDAIIYQLHVRAYCDANGDGIGDFRGLTSKLDYIRDLGVTAIWLLPFFPSPLRDDGYDIADYTAVNPAYGTLRDVKHFLEEAHARDLRVITELVMNHTSDQHEWFQKSRRAKPGSKWRDFYVWSDTPDKYQEARIIFQDFEPSNWTWDPVAQAYFWHRFYHHQPDLNFDNPAVHEAMLATIDFWYDLGVDGVRLDAVPYLYEREGTNCENLPETHAFLAKLRKHVDEKYADKMLLAEANQWPEDAAAYFGTTGDECHMNFHFPLMPRLFMSLEREDRFPIIDILEQTPAIPDNCQWGIFLRNHDELTLEMVTDEERDYMYRAYADDPRARVNLGIRRRLAPLLKDNRRKIELMNALLLSLPGTPIVYYGDELPMGDNIYLGDRDGCRTPMQWNDDRNAGFSRANPQRLYLPVNIDSGFHYATRNVEVELSKPHSLLWWTRRIVSLRKQHKAFGRGSLKFLRPKNPKVLCYLREYEDETILVVANLSRYAQCAEVDLSSFRGQTPVELFGQTRFPPIGTLPYFFTLGPYAFYWFRLSWLEKESPKTSAELPKCRISGHWDSLFTGRALAQLEAALPGFLKRHRWFTATGRVILRTKVMDVIPLHDVPTLPTDRPREGKESAELPPTRILLVNVDFVDGGADVYTLPVVFATGDQQQNILGDHPSAGIVRVLRGEEEATLCDSTRESEFWLLLQDAALRRRAIAGKRGELISVPLSNPARLHASLESEGNGAPHLHDVVVPATERRNARAVVGGAYQWKLFRRTGEGENPDLEISRYLSEQAHFQSVPQLAAGLDYVDAEGEHYTLAVAHQFITNQGTAWQYTLDELQRYFERIQAEKAGQMPPAAILPSCSLLQMAGMEVPEGARDAIGSFLPTAELLGRRTAELHFALASNDVKEFTPAPFSKLYQRSIYQSIRVRTLQSFESLRQQMEELPPPVKSLAEGVLAREVPLFDLCRAVKDRRITAQRLRCHGDLDLLHVLFTGKDFVIINFEGEHSRPLSERRIKTTPIKDVSSMIRSLHYASQAAPMKSATDAPPSEEERANLTAWLKVWYRWSAAAFLKSYLATAAAGSFLPTERESLSVLLNAYLLDKAALELSYELLVRPERVAIPLDGMLELLQHC